MDRVKNSKIDRKTERMFLHRVIKDYEEYNKTWTGTEGSVEERATNIYKMKQLILSFGLQCNTLHLVPPQVQRTLLSPHPYHTPCTVGGMFHHRNQYMGVCMAGALYMAHCKVPCHTAHSTTFCNDGGCTTIRTVPATTVQIWLVYMSISCVTI